MITAIVLITVVFALVLVSRWRETPKANRPSFFRWLRHQRFKEQARATPIDATAQQFAEQWSAHPTLSQRQVNAAKRSMRKKQRD